MGDCMRFLFMTGMVVVVALAGAVQQPECARSLGVEKYDVAYLRRALLGKSAECVDYDPHDSSTLRRIEIKETIVGDLIDGQISLFEAAARFRRLDKDIPPSYTSYYVTAGTEEERLCRDVIHWTANVLQANPGRASEDFVTRLEMELRRQLDVHGSVVLPEVS